MDYRSLIQKYDVPGPRYTSYPTVPYWEASSFSVEAYENQLKTVGQEDDISVYVHLPFCESLCTYCGCTTRITKNHNYESPYIDSLRREWDLYKSRFEGVPQIKEIHFGGGTPTFFNPQNLESIINYITCDNKEKPSISLEGHPNSTSLEHLQVLKDLGCTRLSLGIQDFNPLVQSTINRHQTVEQVEKVVMQARELGYSSINFDLIYGLPHQTLESIEDTIHKTIGLRPERIAFYSYAHVPWLKKAQKSFEEHLPSAEEKRKLYELGKTLLSEAGYIEIGMDHFALENDELASAFNSGTLHRNFMGYTTNSTRLAIGLGVSSISDTWTSFAQNTKDLRFYNTQLEEGKLPIERGHILTPDDASIRQMILDLMCRFQTEVVDVDLYIQVKSRLAELEKDQLISWDEKTLSVTDAGKPFVRNICMAFDLRMLEGRDAQVQFSRTI